MRLWHVDLISYLPRTQLLSQKRECDLIYKNLGKDKKTNHILINYMWKCDIKEFHNYYFKLRIEFDNRGYEFNASPYYVESNEYTKPFMKYHDNQYLLQCYYNLQEKYMRGQKDFDYYTYKSLKVFVAERTKIYEL